MIIGQKGTEFMKLDMIAPGLRAGARLALFCSAASIIVAPAFAQDAAEAPSPIDDTEIVVTA